MESDDRQQGGHPKDTNQSPPHIDQHPTHPVNISTNGANFPPENNKVSDNPDDIEDGKDIPKSRTFNYVNIIVSGHHFKTLHETLLRFPDTLLGNPIKRQKFWDEKRRALVFHRCRQSFESILYFYQSGGSIIQPVNVEQDIFLEEAKFFKLPLLEFFTHDDYDSSPVGERKVQKTLLEERVYAMVQDNETMGWKALALFDVGMTFVFVALQCLRTVEGLRGFSQQNQMVAVEAVCIVWFLMIFSLRLLIANNKKDFLLQFMSLVDMAVIICFFIDVAIYIKLPNVPESGSGSIIAVTACLREVGFMRLFNIARYSELLFCLGVALKRSLADLAQVLILIFLVTFVFATLAYYIEEDRMNSEANQYRTFASVFDAIYWGTITIATVGYGDIAPKTPGGKSVGAALALLGLPLIAIPMPLIMSKFDGYYKYVKRKKENNEVREKIMEEMRERDDSEDEDDPLLIKHWNRANGNKTTTGYISVNSTDIVHDTRDHDDWNKIVAEGYRGAIIDNNNNTSLAGIYEAGSTTDLRPNSRICLSFSDLSRIFPSVDTVNQSRSCSRSRGLQNTAANSCSSLPSLVDDNQFLTPTMLHQNVQSTRGTEGERGGGGGNKEVSVSVMDFDEMNKREEEKRQYFGKGTLARRASTCR